MNDMAKMTNSIRSHHIRAWLFGDKYYLKSRLYIENEGYLIDSLWLNFDQCIGLHQAADFPLVPFDKSREQCWAYLDAACSIIGRQEGRPGRALSEDIAQKVIEALGPPPFASYSIYMITIEPPGGPERAVYIGQTNAESHRFKSGHTAISKLHAPNYDGYKKRIYFGCVSARNDDGNTFPVEWMPEEYGREEILSSVEYEMIFSLKPVLNNKGKNTYLVTRPLPITVQNLAGPQFLDAQCFGPDEFGEE
jgi:hypothetical protein